ncbi:hypothetical protein ABVT39_021184 [Epinephelus coioides]
MTQLVICSDSNYAHHSFISHFPMWKQNDMKNAQNKQVKHSERFFACYRFMTDWGMTVYWKKVKGYSQVSGSEKDGNDEAYHLAKLGADQGTPWEFQNDWLLSLQTCVMNAITCRQTKERRKDSQTGMQTLHLGRKPGDADLVTMQEQDPALHTIRQLVANPPDVALQTPLVGSKEL